jgi:hypothetical protein
MALNSTIYAAISGTLTGSPDLGTSRYQLQMNAALLNLANGTGDNQADKIFSDTRTLAASANEDLDLAGVLSDPLGAALTFAKVKAILVKASTGNTNNVVVGGQATNGFLGPFGALAHTVAVPPGGALLLAAPKAGWAVTAGTVDLLKVANSAGGTSVTYDIVILGTSA